MKGTLDMVLARRPRPYGERDLPFEVYVGNGRLQPISRYLESHPNPRYVAFEERLRDLAVGRYGERAGDVMLLAHDGDRDRPEDRYYFATTPYRSVHGSPSRRDSEIPLILAHRGKTTAALRRLVERRLGQNGRADEIAALLLDLRRDRSLRK
jgi:hypothetical protein